MRSYKSQGVMVSVQGTSILKGILILMVSSIMMFIITSAIVSLKPGIRPASSSISTIATNLSGESLIHILGYENHYFKQALPENSIKPSFASAIFKAATNINPDDPRSLLGRELPGFSMFDSKIIIAGKGTNYTNLPIESAPPLEVLLDERKAATQNLEELEKPKEDKPVTPPAMTTGDKKVVYIYHTHSWESYFPLLKGVDTSDANKASHPDVNVTKVGELLSEELKARGIGSEVNKTNMNKYLNSKGYGWLESYKGSGELFASAMASNQDLRYFIDIHRDDRRKKTTTVEINGKSYAKIAFVVGTDNAKLEQNIAIASKLQAMFDKEYPGLSRGVIQKGGKGNNGVYNQDKSGNAMLIEFGGVDNTYEELSRTVSAVADVFAEYYWQAEKVDAPAGDTNKE